MKIGILSTSPNSHLVEAAKKRGHEVMHLNPNEMYLYLSEITSGYDLLYMGNDGDKPERINASSLDCVINRIGNNTDFATFVLQFMTENLGIYCPNHPLSIPNCSNKARTLQILSANGIPIPRTIVAHKPNHIKWIVDKIGSLPIVIKSTTGSQGNKVGICDTKTSANSMFSFIYNNDIEVLIEQFIDAGASDYRCWVVGNDVPITMKRTAKDKNEWRANISKGGGGEKAVLSKEDKELVIKAAHSLGMNIAGVDLIKDKTTGKSYIIEINSNPGTKIIDLTGHNVMIDVVKFCEDNYKKGNSSNGFFGNYAVIDLNSISNIFAKNRILEMQVAVNEVLLMKSNIKK